MQIPPDGHRDRVNWIMFGGGTSVKPCRTEKLFHPAVRLAGLPYFDWAIRGFRYHDRHVIVTVDGVTYEIDSQVWPTHPLNPRNRVSAPKAGPTGGP
jgi:hypothetical protein